MCTYFLHNTYHPKRCWWKMDLKGRKWEYEIQNIYPWIYLPETSLAVCPGVSVHHTAPGLPLVPLDNNVVVVYHVLIVPMGHKLLKKLWPMVIGCILRTAGSSLVWKNIYRLLAKKIFSVLITFSHFPFPLFSPFIKLLIFSLPFFFFLCTFLFYFCIQNNPKF